MDLPLSPLKLLLPTGRFGPPYNTWFTEPTRVFNPNSISIGSAILGDRLYNSTAVAEMGYRLATIGMGRKWGGAAVGAGSLLGPHLTQCDLG